jgi:predicted nucleotidyltransferase
LGDKLYKIILFGSYARGDNDNESDIDIMVLSETSTAEELKAKEDLVWDIRLGYRGRLRYNGDSISQRPPALL